MIVYRLLSILIHGMALIPLPVGRVLGKGLGRLFPILPTSRTSIVLENIRRAFPGTEWAKNPKKLLRKVYLHFGQMLFEVPHILRMNPANMDRYVLFEGKEILERVLAKGKGCFLLTAHFGNWEMMSAAVTLLFPRLAIVVRPIDFAPLDRLISEIRTRFGTEIIPKRKAMRQVLKAIKEKKNVGILLDQNVDWYEGVFVDFLGRRACTNKGLARLALKTGAHPDQERGQDQGRGGGHHPFHQGNRKLYPQAPRPLVLVSPAMEDPPILQDSRIQGVQHLPTSQRHGRGMKQVSLY
ncbi:MAG: lysophospholipid acyltransferase family protein [Deltaproteobacteria bacterium]|nr:lysophospholipid acyltransferase family protein [Deltaproteobacteria bacterium]